MCATAVEMDVKAVACFTIATVRVVIFSALCHRSNLQRQVEVKKAPPGRFGKSHTYLICFLLGVSLGFSIDRLVRSHLNQVEVEK